MSMNEANEAVRGVSQLRRYQEWLKAHRGLCFDDYQALHRWSVEDLEGFWRSIWDYHRIESPTSFRAALCVDRMPGTVWFDGAKVNYARQVFRHAEAADAAGQPAIVSENELGVVRQISWQGLKQQVFSLALTLRELGVRPGDRIAAYLPNGHETVVAFLACSSLGAVWSLCAPDMGSQAILDRFGQIEPKVLIAVDGVHYAGMSSDRSVMVMQLRAALPSLDATISVAPDSYKTCPNGMSTCSSNGCQRCHSGSGSAANRAFSLCSTEIGIPDFLLAFLLVATSTRCLCERQLSALIRRHHYVV